MKKLIFLILFSLSFNLFGALKDLESQGFKCKPSVFAKIEKQCSTCGLEPSLSISCTGMMKNYPELVTIVFNRQALDQSPTDIATFFHGLTMGSKSVNEDVLKRFKFEDKVAKMSRPFAMIIPHYQSYHSGTRKNTHLHYNYLYKESDYQKFENEARELMTEKSTKSNMHLLGHSGAYRVLAKRAMDKKLNVESVTMIDAAYGNSDQLSQFENQPLKKWVSYYIKGTPTAVQNEAIQKSLKSSFKKLKGMSSVPSKAGTTFIELSSQETNHWGTVDHAFAQFLN